MAKVESHRDLIVWQKAMRLAVEVYRLTATFPCSEEYRITAQITRAAASVPANIAEGHARSTRRDYANFLAIAKGSLAETETFVLLALELQFTTSDQAGATLDLIQEISKMLTALRARLVRAL
jgi:four helix bundle protein